RAGYPRSECCYLTRVCGIQYANPTATEITEEVFARVLGRKLINLRVVEGAACNCAAVGVRILIDGVAEIGVGRAARPFASRPTIVCSSESVVNFFPGVLADIIDENPACAGLDGKSERITKTQRPNSPVGICRGVVKRIVHRD